jgi:hypothetical protein
MTTTNRTAYNHVAYRIAYNLTVAICFAALLTVEIIRCFSPLVAVLRYRVERTIEWYSLPTVTPNWHTLRLIGSLAVTLWQRSLRSRLPVATVVNISPNLNLLIVSEDADRRFC